jgi:hypothetical protein
MKQNDDSVNAVLSQSLLELKRALDPSGVPIIIGGGMGLYLRETYLPEERSPRYQFRLPIRSTNDLDIFLTADMAVNAAGFGSIKAVLSDLKYTVSPKAEYFQFEKEVEVYGARRTVKIDLLAAPPREADEGKVKVKGIRVRPKGVRKIHAFLTEEARGIDIGRIELHPSKFDSSADAGESPLYIPSRFNYLILKTAAFFDRKDKGDEKSNYGRHHAYDVFATVTAMSEGDWDNAGKHYKAHKDLQYVQKAASIRREYFSAETDLGVIRLKENIKLPKRKVRA